MHPGQVLTVAVLWGLFASGCAPGAHVTANRPSIETKTDLYLAQAATCTQLDSTMTCCIKNHPTNPVEACGAAAWEIAEVLNGAKALDEAAKAAASKQADKEPEWKKQCMRRYERCIEEDWLGTWRCIDCFRYCEGQQGQWPSDKCYPPTGR